MLYVRQYDLYVSFYALCECTNVLAVGRRCVVYLHYHYSCVFFFGSTAINPT